MSKPLTEAEKKLLAQFVSGIVQGSVSLGFSSLSMLDLYKRAQEHRQGMLDILVSDPDGLVALARSAREAVARIPPSALVVLKQLIEEAQQLQTERMARGRGVPAGASNDPDDV